MRIVRHLGDEGVSSNGEIGERYRLRTHRSRAIATRVSAALLTGLYIGLIQSSIERDGTILD
jgi:hypothetical protein